MFFVYKTDMGNQIEYYDLSLQAYKRIKDMILNDEIPAGKKIVQEKLATELGVSRMPLHKAFQMLENEMLVESIPRRGYFVKKFDPQEIIDAFECREAIEGVAARKAAGKITKEEVLQLYDLFKPFEDDLNNIDISAYQKADQEFHKLILQISGNKVLQKMEMFSNILKKTYQRGLIRKAKDTFNEHITIINALENHDGELAEKLLRIHFRRSLEKIFIQLKNV